MECDVFDVTFKVETGLKDEYSEEKVSVAAVDFPAALKKAKRYAMKTIFAHWYIARIELVEQKGTVVV